MPPRLQRTLDGLGQKLQLARLRRLYTAELVAERAGISRATLSRAEHGDPATRASLRDWQRVAVDAGIGKRELERMAPAFAVPQ